VHRDVDRDDLAVGQHGRGDPLGDGLDQVGGLPREHACDLLGQHAVVERVREIVGRRGAPGVEVRDHVRPEHLPLATLVLEHPVVADRGDADQTDLVELATGAVQCRSRMPC